MHGSAVLHMAKITVVTEQLQNDLNWQLKLSWEKKSVVCFTYTGHHSGILRVLRVQA